MHSNQRPSGAATSARAAKESVRNAAATMLGALAVALGAGSASAQELTHRFINPSFGGNPFNSDHLLGVATAQRPERPRTEDEQRELSETEQFARQIQSRLLSALSSSLVESITGSAPGTTGEFVVGDQRIFFERTLSEIRLRITNEISGEVTEIVVPVLNFNNPNGSPLGTAQASAGEGSLSAGLLSGLTGQSPIGPLEGGPLEPKGSNSGGLVN